MIDVLVNESNTWNIDVLVNESNTWFQVGSQTNPNLVDFKLKIKKSKSYNILNIYLHFEYFVSEMEIYSLIQIYLNEYKRMNNVTEP